MKEALKNQDDQTISTKSLKELVEIVLKNNIFEHDGKLYNQKKRTAIGTKIASSFAILFMDALEKGILDGLELKPSAWWRYNR